MDLYPNWNNEFVQAYGNAIVPESYTFDLTGFCMPTPNTRITDVFGYRPRRRRAHYGLDIKVYVGDTIRAAFDGKYALSRIKVVVDTANTSLFVTTMAWKQFTDTCLNN